MSRRDALPRAVTGIVEAWRGRRVVILGDMILDEFLYGRTERVSREAPVVIVRYDGIGYSPGGAANAAQNVAALGGRAVPVGFIGGDGQGKILRRLLRERGVTVRGLVALGRRCTTSKTRIMAGDYHAQRQQIVRIDREQERCLSGRDEDRILEAFEREAASAHAVILSDYDQRVFSERVLGASISYCRKHRIPVIADSRFRLARFEGVTTATPNEIEAARAAGMELDEDRALERIGRKLIGLIGSDSLLVTRGRFGMTLFERRRRTKSIGVFGSTEATDVTGAGDTVVAAVALTLASGGDMITAMHVANLAASIVVMKRGTATATASELLALVGREPREDGTGCT